MKVKRHNYILPAYILLAGFAHWLVQWNLFSFVVFPVAISAFLAYAQISSFTALGVLALVSELFSTLPPGISTTAILMPFIIKRLAPPTISIGFHRLFFILLAATILVQLAIISLPDLFFWNTLPLYPMLTVWATTTTFVFAFVVIWHETQYS